IITGKARKSCIDLRGFRNTACAQPCHSSPMPIALSCPSCHADLKLRDDLVGRKVKCPKCREIIKVPDAGSKEQEEVRPAVKRKRREDPEEEKRARRESRRSDDDEDDGAQEDEENRPNGLDHEAKVARLLKDMKRRGVAVGSAAPPLFRMLWAMGISLPPPFFLGFLTNMLLMGIPMGIGWSGAMWLLQWKGIKMPAGLAVAGTAAFALLFGASMGFYYQWKARSLKLPPWNTYPRGKHKRDPWWMVGPIVASLGIVAIGAYAASEAQKWSRSIGGLAVQDQVRPKAVDIWRPLTAPEGGFEILMPGVPKRWDHTANLMGKSVPRPEYKSTTNEGGEFTISYFDYPENTPEMREPEFLFDQLRNDT